VVNLKGLKNPLHNLLIIKIKNMTNLVLNVGPNQLVSDQGLKIAFFDKKNEITKNYDLWVHIAIPNDPNTISIRKAIERAIYDQGGEKTFIHEKDLYKIAYKKYLALQKDGKPDPETELVKLRAEIEALKANTTSVAILENEEEDKRTASELKIELDNLGIEYKGNASREVLLNLFKKR
jgi:hypothetical protein